MQDYIRAEVLSNALMGDSIRHLILKPLKEVSYDAGQFFLLRARQENGELVERSYSAANYGDPSRIEFVIRIESQGKMTTLIDLLKEGDEIDMKGPFGKFGFAGLPQEMDQLILVGGGVGISPLRSMLQEHQLKNKSFPVKLFYGFRTPNDMLFQDELESLVTAGNLELVTAISEASSEWLGNQGYISDFLAGHLEDPQPGMQFCICGPPPMVKASREKLLELGFERSQVHVEAW